MTPCHPFHMANDKFGLSFLKCPIYAMRFLHLGSHGFLWLVNCPGCTCPFEVQGPGSVSQTGPGILIRPGDPAPSSSDTMQLPVDSGCKVFTFVELSKWGRPEWPTVSQYQTSICSLVFVVLSLFQPGPYRTSPALLPFHSKTMQNAQPWEETQSRDGMWMPPTLKHSSLTKQSIRSLDNFWRMEKKGKEGRNRTGKQTQICFLLPPQIDMHIHFKEVNYD